MLRKVDSLGYATFSLGKILNLSVETGAAHQYRIEAVLKPGVNITWNDHQP